MNFNEFILLLLSVCSSVAGQFLLKSGAMKLGKVTSDTLFSHILSILNVPELLMGLCCYGIGAIAYILLLTRVNLSVAGPSVSLVYIFTVLIGYIHFHETLPIGRLLGLSLITSGVILVVWKY